MLIHPQTKKIFNSGEKNMDRKGIIEIKSVQLEKDEEKVVLTYNISAGGGKYWKHLLSLR